jgi:hypothetical protein
MHGRVRARRNLPCPRGGASTSFAASADDEQADNASAATVRFTPGARSARPLVDHASDPSQVVGLGLTAGTPCTAEFFLPEQLTDGQHVPVIEKAVSGRQLRRQCR